MALGTLIAGAYTGTYGGSALGITEQGFELSWRTVYEDVRESDQYGAQLIEQVYRGVTDVMLQINALEYKTGPIAAMWSAGTFGQPGVIGRLASAMAASTVLTAVAGTPAAASPATLTAARTIVSDGQVRIAFHSKLRKVPFQLRLLHNSDAGTAYFVTT